MKLRFVKKVQHGQILAVCPLLLHGHHGVLVGHILKIQLAHAGPVKCAPMLHQNLGILMGLLNQLPGEGGENRGDGLMVILALAGKMGKLLVHPQELTGIIHQGIGNLQLIQQLLLHGSILGGKIHKLVENGRLAEKIYNCHNGKVEDRNSSHQKPQPDIRPIGRNITQDQQYC